MKDLAKKLRKLRTDAKLTQKESAEMLSVSERTWQNWEAGATRVPPSVLELYQIYTTKAL